MQKIPHSNLILLVVDTLCPCGSKQLDIEPQEIPGGAGRRKKFKCHNIFQLICVFLGACGTRRLAREMMQRNRPPKCINYHPEEIEIQQCGRATALTTANLLVTLTTSLLMWIMAVHA